MRIGITERGDPAFDRSWVGKVTNMDGAIVISKNVGSILHDITPLRKKLVVHVTITGMGGTIVEPRVPSPSTKAVLDLFQAGFSKEQVVLRIDPVFPTVRGRKTAIGVLEMFKDTPIERVRFSFGDMYGHVADRFHAAHIPLPYEGFTAPQDMRKAFLDDLRLWESRYSFESCAEDTPYRVGCVSARDLLALGLDPSQATGKSQQRKACLCLGCKTELLDRPKPCGHGCLYCYWR